MPRTKLHLFVEKHRAAHALNTDSPIAQPPETPKPPELSIPQADLDRVYATLRRMRLDDEAAKYGSTLICRIQIHQHSPNPKEQQFLDRLAIVRACYKAAQTSQAGKPSEVA